MTRVRGAVEPGGRSGEDLPFRSERLDASAAESRAPLAVAEAIMIFWSRTEDGWAVNLDGSDAAIWVALPRVELRSSPRGWECAYRLPDGTSRLVPLGRPAGVAEAMRLAIEGSLQAFNGRQEADLRALLCAPR